MATASSTYIQAAERRGLVCSAVAHVVLLLIFIIGLPQFSSRPDLEEATAISVEILPIGKVSNVKPTNSKPIKKKEKPKPKKKEIITKDLQELKETKKKASPKVKTEDSTPAPPKAEEKADAKEEEKPKDKPKKEKPKKEVDPLDAILKGVKDTAAKEKDESSASEQPEDSSQNGGRSNSFDPNSPEALAIRDAIQGQVYKCWNVPAGARNAENLIIPLEIDYDQRGNPVKVNLAKEASGEYRNDPFFRAAADSAIRAVRRCAPLRGLPPQDYAIWQYVNMSFNPQELLF